MVKADEVILSIIAEVVRVKKFEGVVIKAPDAEIQNARAKGVENVFEVIFGISTGRCFGRLYAGGWKRLFDRLGFHNF